MMKMKLNRLKMRILVAVIVTAGAGWLIYSRFQAHQELPVASRSVADQELVDKVMDAPEQFDSAFESSKQRGSKPDLSERQEISVTSVTGEEKSTEAVVAANSITRISRPNLLSAVEKPTHHKPQVEPVSAENLYFWKDYASMRKDAINNPDSPENRAGVVALMKARQNRLGKNQ